MSVKLRVGFIVLSLLYMVYLMFGVSMNNEMSVVAQPLPYEAKLQRRESSDIDTIVLHCTELPTLAMAREFGERVLYQSGTGNSGHYYVDRDGGVYRYVVDERVANHTRGYNPRSIGIELINLGRYPEWYHKDSQQATEQYTQAQMDSLVALIEYLTAQHPSIVYIAGHEDLDVAMMEAEDDPTVMIRRKVDPGPLFDWPLIESQFDLQRLFAEKASE